MIIYHLTKKENIEEIKSKGLIPSIGRNSNRVSEDRKNVFLTDEKYLNVWGHFLESNIVIKLNIDEKDIVDTFDYDYYSEKLADYIPVEKILEIKDFSPVVDNLCLKVFEGMIYTINLYSLRIVRSYYRITNSDISEKEKEDLLKIEIEEFYSDSLSWWTDLNLSIKSILGEDSVRKIFEELGRDGEYTLFDYNIANNIKLIDDLSNVKLPTQSKLLEKYIESLHKEFDFCKDLCTGGWE